MYLHSESEGRSLFIPNDLMVLVSEGLLDAPN